MARDSIYGIIGSLRRAALVHDAYGITDGQLLERFLTSHEEAAFAALVHRHAPMVMGVCRRVLGNLHDAEDAFQATFLVLARRATAIVPRDQVGNWLYGVAHRTALKARTMARRRHQYESGAAAARCLQPARDLDQELRFVLDQELERLPTNYRAVVVLCDLEGKTKRAAARQLGVPQGTISSRLARGRALLRVRLARRGVTLSTSALLSSILQQAAPAVVPRKLLVDTVKAATQFAVGQMPAGCLASSVAVLAEGMVRTLVMSKLKLVAFTLAVIMVGLSTGVGVYNTRAAEQPELKEETNVASQATPHSGHEDLVASAQRGTPKQLPPMIAVVALDEKGRIIVRHPRFRDVAPPGLLAVTFALDKVRAREVGGNPIRPKELAQRLKGETLALVAMEPEVVDDPCYLRLLSKGTLIIALPAPESVTAPVAAKLSPAPRANVSPNDRDVDVVVERAFPATGDVAWDQLGLRLEPVGAAAVSRAHHELHGGMRVVAVRSSSPATAARIKPGDILVGLHHWETTTRDAVSFTVGYAQGAAWPSLKYILVGENQISGGEFQLPWNKAK